MKYNYQCDLLKNSSAASPASKDVHRESERDGERGREGARVTREERRPRWWNEIFILSSRLFTLCYTTVRRRSFLLFSCDKPAEFKKADLYDVLQWLRKRWCGDLQVERHLEVLVKSGLNLAEKWKVFRRLGRPLPTFLTCGPLKWSNVFLWPLATGSTRSLMFPLETLSFE